MDGDGGRRGEHHRVIIIGAGFAGIGLAISLRRAGTTDLVLLERGDDVGGVWRDNTYPGAECDVQSHLYSFSFAPNPGWSRQYSPQPEIQRYLRDVADRFAVRPLVRFGTEVRRAAWDPAVQRWRLETSAGPFTADVLVAATGSLSAPAVPALPGLDRFEGTSFHSAAWRHDHDLHGERVAVVGTGASAVQFVPHVQPRVDRLHVFQRTAPWVLPRDDREIGAATRDRFRRHPALQRLARARIYWERELLVLGFAVRPSLMRLGEQAALAFLAREVADPDLRATLTPTFTLGCKRVLLSNDWYRTLTQPNVEVVADRITEVRARSIVTADGVERRVDTIIFGTGFEVTAHPVFDHVVGTDGRSLAEHWSAGMRAHHGTTVPGFPNLFVMTGPNTGLGHTSVVVMMEAQFRYVVKALAALDRAGARVLEVRDDVTDAEAAALQRRLAGTVWSTGCASWYLDARGHNTTMWPGFTWEYVLRLWRFDADAYRLAPARGDGAQGQPSGIPSTG